MKKILCAALCVMLLMISAVSFAAISYTLPEKMEKQLDIGSGLKGSLTLHGEGTDELILTLQPLQDVELQVRGMKSEGDAHYYIYQAGENEEQKGLTELYLQGEAMYLRSDLLPGEIYTLSGLEALSGLIYTPEGGNPSLLPALMGWMSLSGEEQNAALEPVISSLSSQLEIWAARYVTVSEVRTLESGVSAVDLTYDIPMNDMKQEVVTLLKSLMGSEAGQAFLEKLLTEEQREVFANEHLDYFYLAAMDALDNDYDVLYTQTVSTLGDPVSSTLELPLDERVMKYQALVIEENDDLISYTLRGEEKIITLTLAQNIDWTEIDGISAWIIIRPNPASESEEKGEYHALRVEVSHTVEVSTDEETRDHQREQWLIRAVRDVSRLPEGEEAENYPEETPRTLDIQLHYYSRYSQSSPTTLEFEASLTKENFDLKVSGQMKTASPWIFSPFDTEGAVDLTTMTAETRELKLAELLAGAAEQLTPTEKTEEAEETAATEDGEETAENEEAPAIVTEEAEAAEDKDMGAESESAEVDEGKNTGAEFARVEKVETNAEEIPEAEASGTEE